MRGSSLNRGISWFTHCATKRRGARSYGILLEPIDEVATPDAGRFAGLGVGECGCGACAVADASEMGRAAETGDGCLEVCSGPGAGAARCSDTAPWLAEIDLRRTHRHDLRERKTAPERQPGWRATIRGLQWSC